MSASKVQVPCTYCGKIMERYPSKVDRYENNFCSRECYGDYLSDHNRGEGHPNWSGNTAVCEECGDEFHIQPSTESARKHLWCSDECRRSWYDVEKTCPGCGGVFTVLRSRDYRKYCSHECYIADNDVPLPQRDHGESQPYGTALWQRQRDRALQRDGETCQRCGRGSSEVTLHVHHKTPWKRFETSKEAHALDNLITLCQACHNKVEAE